MADNLEFYDVKAKKKFSTNKYTIEVKTGRRFAVAISPYTQISSYRIVGK